MVKPFYDAFVNIQEIRLIKQENIIILYLCIEIDI